MASKEIELITADNNLYAKLIIPTRSEGATFGASSTSIGKGISVGGTAGEIEEDPYEDYVSRLSVAPDGIYLGVILSKADTQPRLLGSPKKDAKKGKPPDKTISVASTDITNIRREKVEQRAAMVFETAQDLYQIKFGATGRLSLAFHSRDEDADPLDDAIKLIEENMSRETATNEAVGGNNSMIDELERLADLHERGALSDEEFQAAKDEIL